MFFLLILIASYGGVWLYSRRKGWDERDRWAGALGIAMLVAGLMHLLMPDPFVQHIPPWVPGRRLLVFGTGIVEMLFGPALWLTRDKARSWVGWALAAYLVLVFPGNVYVAVEGVDVEGQPDGIYGWLRLPLQLLFVWLALWSTGVLVALRERRHGAVSGP